MSDDMVQVSTQSLKYIVPGLHLKLWSLGFNQADKRRSALDALLAMCKDAKHDAQTMVARRMMPLLTTDKSKRGSNKHDGDHQTAISTLQRELDIPIGK